MAGNASALPGLPPPEEPDENYELPDGIPPLQFIKNLQVIGRDAGVGGSDGEYQSHTIGDDEEESKSSSYLRPHGHTLTGFSRWYGLGGHLESHGSR